MNEDNCGRPTVYIGLVLVETGADLPAAHFMIADEACLAVAGVFADLVQTVLVHRAKVPLVALVVVLALVLVNADMVFIFVVARSAHADEGTGGVETVRVDTTLDDRVAALVFINTSANIVGPKAFPALFLVTLVLLCAIPIGQKIVSVLRRS
ncbi:hypothetical protein V1264_017048 [Littorina saxatilis]|uniref:Uncharacterized protein n=1 Tax=Littorina saxatilis TaxID=31220 RepID=A0AAN9BID9_9CAEN